MKKIAPKIFIFALIVSGLGLQSFNVSLLKPFKDVLSQELYEHSAPQFSSDTFDFKLLKEDDQKFVYKLTIKPSGLQSLQMVARDGVLTIAGKIVNKAKKNAKNLASVHTLPFRFSQNFLLPENIDDQSLKYSQESNQFLVSFNKRSVSPFPVAI